jgi:hypothetical protein
MVNEQDNYINDIEHQLIKLFQINSKNKQKNHDYKELIQCLINKIIILKDI